MSGKHAKPAVEAVPDVEPAEVGSPAAPPEDPYVVGLKREIAERELRLGELEAQVRHYAQSFDKARTEYEASRERMQRENKRNATHEKVKLVSGLLGVLDSFDRSLASVKNQEPTAAFVDGVLLIRAQFEGALAGLGLVRFDGVGEPFDPTRHQAVTSMPVADPAQAGRVVACVGAGVLVGDEVVRAASVVVGQSAAAADPETADSSAEPSAH